MAPTSVELRFWFVDSQPSISPGDPYSSVSATACHRSTFSTRIKKWKLYLKAYLPAGARLPWPPPWWECSLNRGAGSLSLAGPRTRTLTNPHWASVERIFEKVDFLLWVDMLTCQLGSRALVIQMPILWSFASWRCWQPRKATESSRACPSEHHGSCTGEQEEKGSRRSSKRMKTKRWDITASVPLQRSASFNWDSAWPHRWACSWL